MKTTKEKLNFSIINLDKSSGPTSFTVSEYVKKQLGLGKTSHFGTLDPKVTGVLPVALGRACKLTGFFLGHDKEYVGILHTHKEQDMEKLQEIINKNFTGKIKQLPPIKSRVKRAVREREVKRFELIEQDGKDILFIAEVEGGTYIRKLCSDLGDMIGGAHMLELRRVRAGIFSEEDKLVDLNEFTDAVEEYKSGQEEKLLGMLTSGEEVIKEIFPIVEVKKQALKQLLTGKPLFKKDVVGKLPKEDVFAVFLGTRFVEIVEKTDKKGRDVVARALFVYN
tara:strand:- start:6132 stop:6971 length:840 start_codon:yes stop_codon:yes gene_type:complete